MSESNGVGKTPKHVTDGTSWDQSAGTLNIKWADGQASTFSLGELPQSIQNDLMYAGALGRIQQSYVGAKGDPGAAREKAGKLWANMKAGKLGLQSSDKSYNVTVQALAALLSISLEEAEKRFDAKSLADKRAIGKRPDVRAKIAEIRATGAKVDADLSAAL